MSMVSQEVKSIPGGQCDSDGQCLSVVALPHRGLHGHASTE